MHLIICVNLTHKQEIVTMKTGANEKKWYPQQFGNGNVVKQRGKNCRCQTFVFFSIVYKKQCLIFY